MTTLKDKLASLARKVADPAHHREDHVELLRSGDPARIASGAKRVIQSGRCGSREASFYLALGIAANLVGADPDAAQYSYDRASKLYRSLYR